jgi:hypothetical protein
MTNSVDMELTDDLHLILDLVDLVESQDRFLRQLFQIERRHDASQLDHAAIDAAREPGKRPVTAGPEHLRDGVVKGVVMVA